MLNPSDTGRIIAKLRKQAGFTQQSLADALCVTDKAVSKWERGISCPDISLLPKLSILLDADIEALLSGVADIYSHKWKGVLYVPDGSFPLDTLVYDKPLVYYLLGNFLLVGITDVLIITSIKTKWDDFIFEEINESGFDVKFFLRDGESLTQCFKENGHFIKGSNTFVITDVCFLFGASLTRTYQSFMAIKEGAVRLSINDMVKTPLIFISEEHWELFYNRKNSIDFDGLVDSSIKKNLGRGTIYLPIKNHKQLCDVSSFVKFYQEYHCQQICDLREISVNREIPQPEKTWKEVNQQSVEK